MEPREWRTTLRDAADAAIGHLERLDERPVGARVGHEAMRARVLAPLPATGTPAPKVVAELQSLVEGGLTQVNSPRFFGWVMGGSTPAGLAADWLAAVWEQNTALGEVTPATVALEEVAADWCRALLELPSSTSLGFVTGGQMANWVGLAAARDGVLDAVGWDVEAHGLQGAPPVHVVAGAEWHTTVPRALRFLGLGAETATLVDVDDQGRMQPEALDAALDRLDGPVVVVAAAGNVNSGAFDPLDELVDVADGHRAVAPGRVWVHVDGAFGLWAAASPRHRHLVRGHDRCDSWATDAHKWLNVPYDCGIAAVRHPEVHRRAMGTRADYIPVGGGGLRQPLDLTPEFSRRARALPVWATIRELGAAGVTAMVDRCCDLARRFADQLGAAPGVEVRNEVVLNQVVVRFADPDGLDDDAHTRRVAERLWTDGTCLATPTTWRGQAGLRISVCNWRTTAADVDRSVAAMLRAHHG
jgi:glutamate/tyrosine decarboxylase-like PLP-dependent enzyme